ncbi:MAG: hypothetical protein M3160_07055 [Candidatus Eremiobacteraeota bacterium]|nr:hypothetical protein [Candidatus Eremiobacteraeota bacterium]
MAHLISVQARTTVVTHTLVRGRECPGATACTMASVDAGRERSLECGST